LIYIELKINLFNLLKKTLPMIKNSFLCIIFFLISQISCTIQDLDKEKFQMFVKNFNDIENNNSLNPERMSESFLLNQLKETKDRLSNLREINIDDLDFNDQIDYKFIQSILIGNEIRNEFHMPWKKDPRRYMNFRQISNKINGPGTCIEKSQFLLDYLPVVINDLSYGKEQLSEYVPRFNELGLFMASNSNEIFDIEIPNFTNKCSIENSDKLKIISLTKQVKERLKEFEMFLKNDLPIMQESSFSLGKTAYNKMLKEQFLLDYNDETLWDYGWKQFNNTIKEMDNLAKKIDPGKTTKQILIDIKNEYPEPDNMIDAHQYWVDKSGEHIKDKNLIPIPWKERVNVVPREEYLRKTSYYGNFSRSKGIDEEGFFTSEWKINPFEDQWDQKTKDEYLVEHDWGVIIVTAPHETYAGHHIQGLYQMHNPRELRRNNGLSLFSEGWGLYNEQLMLETGFYPNDKIKLRQLQLRLWRNARVIYDVGMHTGKMTYEEAINLMTEKVGFLRWAAQLEIDSSSSRPGYFIGYFIGMTEILTMREEYKKIKGDKYDISDFHEKLLKIGNMPPSLMKESLFNLSHGI